MWNAFTCASISFTSLCASHGIAAMQRCSLFAVACEQGASAMKLLLFNCIECLMLPAHCHRKPCIIFRVSPSKHQRMTFSSRPVHAGDAADAYVLIHSWFMLHLCASCTTITSCVAHPFAVPSQSLGSVADSAVRRSRAARVGVLQQQQQQPHAASTPSEHVENCTNTSLQVYHQSASAYKSLKLHHVKFSHTGENFM
jgi:hypothetical protein